MKDRVPGEAAAVISTCFTSISSQSMGLCFAQPSAAPVPFALDLQEEQGGKRVWRTQTVLRGTVRGIGALTSQSRCRGEKERERERERERKGRSRQVVSHGDREEASTLDRADVKSSADDTELTQCSNPPYTTGHSGQCSCTTSKWCYGKGVSRGVEEPPEQARKAAYARGATHLLFICQVCGHVGT